MDAPVNGWGEEPSEPEDNWTTAKQREASTAIAEAVAEVFAKYDLTVFEVVGMLEHTKVFFIKQISNLCDCPHNDTEGGNDGPTFKIDR